MPQMSPCSWMMILLSSNFMLYLFKMNFFFEKKC